MIDLSNGYGTPRSHYATDGPYHCEDCIHQVGEGSKKGECAHPKVIEDAICGKIELLPSGRAEVNLEKGCCTFVMPKVAIKRMEEDSAVNDYAENLGK